MVASDSSFLHSVYSNGETKDERAPMAIIGDEVWQNGEIHQCWVREESKILNGDSKWKKLFIFFWTAILEITLCSTQSWYDAHWEECV